ncbi:MAG: recombinase family protein, partial [Planctomycetota bacterium]
LNILASFSQFEREVISERTRDKVQATRRRGAWTGGRPVLGYDIRDKQLVVNESEAAMVREVFRLYILNGGLVTTVAELARRGIRNKRWRNADGVEVGGAGFDKGTLRTLLTNPVYCGKLRCGNELVTGQQVVIVSDAEFAAAAHALEHNQRGPRTATNKWGALLTGILVCARCGKAMTHAANSRGNRMHRYYVCTTLQKQGAAACPGSRAPGVGLESVVVAKVRAAASDPTILLATIAAARAEREERQPRLLAEIARQNGERTPLLTSRHNLLNAIQNGNGTSESILDRLREVEGQIDDLDTRIRELEHEAAAAQAVAIDDVAVRDALAEFNAMWDHLDGNERVRVLRLLVQQVRFDGQAGEVQIRFHDNGLAALVDDANTRRSA